MENRDIKFRVCDDLKLMSKPFALQDLQDRKIQFTSDCTVMPFTGVLDKDGREIYYKDIIEYTQHYFNTRMVETKRKVVEWRGDRWNIFETKAGETDIKVIGNVYENPELLTEILNRNS